MDIKDKLIGEITSDIRKLPTTKLRELEQYLATTFSSLENIPSSVATIGNITSTIDRPDNLEENGTSPVDTSTFAILEENVTSPVDTSTVASLEHIVNEEDVTSMSNADSGESVHMENILSEHQDNEDTSTSISPHSLHETVKLVSNTYSNT